MVAKLLKAFDATIDFGLTTFKKVLMFVILAAVVASIVTASIMFLGFNAIM